MPLPFRGLALAVLAAAVATTACAQQPAPQSGSPPPPVWVNLSSGVYHCPGTEHYGTTKRGEYLAESAAVEQGYRANDGRYCAPAQASTFDSLRALRAVPAPTSADGGPPPPASGLLRCIVSNVHDGDTIRCRSLGSVRLIGIDSPELDQPPYGAMATKGLLALVAVGDTVQLSTGQEPRDQYDRLLAYAWRGAASINWLMIRQGWAVALEYPPNTRYAEWFRQAESLAEQGKAGLWAVDGFQCRPSRHRAGLC